MDFITSGGICHCWLYGKLRQLAWTEGLYLDSSG